jgi:hypothetical protein|tara:strand:+ start:493 stop:639 length:147 start_codon:yes stop_codon:yes gene_type:complete
MIRWAEAELDRVIHPPHVLIDEWGIDQRQTYSNACQEVFCSVCEVEKI